ncbi:MAG: Histidinol dehydrogenase [Verrucomicrobia subdivision 3 bacterium]|nr:Histidinol dehydrogenase [Limisphaerales bacterium]MCS1413567.1 Histidinol dehydrogenase [Limisphaerales bacterium]
MKVYSYKDKAYKTKVAEMLRSSSLFDQTILDRTTAIVDSVRNQGDRALIRLTKKFDGASLTPETLRVSDTEIVAAQRIPLKIKKAVRAAANNIRAFSKVSKRKNWQMRNSHHAIVGEKFDPFQRVGLYIPGGTAPLISTALMTITLAKVAGCPEIAVCTPCDAEGAVNQDLLFTLKQAGATEIYRLGGAQAIAALALGTQSIPSVNKIFGPGNAYVVAAKCALFGRVAIDLLPGPSEALIIADDSANPDWIAADLMAQAEHGSGHERVVLLTPSNRLLKRTLKSIDRQLPERARAQYIKKALSRGGWCLHVKDLAAAIEITNRFAPEHCEIMTQCNRNLERQITTAGALFLGGYSPTVLGDYVAGPSHVLPTGGAGRSFAGLTVDQFQRRTSIVQYKPASLKKALADVETFAAMEGLDAHGRSASIRIG